MLGCPSQKNKLKWDWNASHLAAILESTCLRQKTIHFEDDCDPPRAKILVSAAPPKELKQIQLENLSPTLKPFKISFNFMADFRCFGFYCSFRIYLPKAENNSFWGWLWSTSSKNLCCYRTAKGAKTNTARKPVTVT